MSAPHVLVTGANRGIGAAIAHTLAADGWRVTLAGRSRDALESARATLPGDGHAVVQMDVASVEDIPRAFAEARAAQGPLHALVNNAGVVETGATQRFPLASWERLLDVNLTGVFLCCQAALADLRETRGRIVNIASTAAQKGYAFTAAYSAAKHGVVGFTRSLALELVPAGIAVNAVCPGYTDTDIIRGGMAQLMDRKGQSEEFEWQGEEHALNELGAAAKPSETVIEINPDDVTP